jgi:hypothetical protein
MNMTTSLPHGVVHPGLNGLSCPVKVVFNILCINIQGLRWGLSANHYTPIPAFPLNGGRGFSCSPSRRKDFS